MPTIEQNLERIADALEALVTLAGAETSKPKAEPKTPPKETAKSADTETPKTEKSEEAQEQPAQTADGDEGLTKEDLRTILTNFQEEHGLEATKELIKPFGPSIGKIKQADYAAVAEAAEAYGA